MIRTCAITSNHEVSFGLPLTEMNNPDIEIGTGWDFSNPTNKKSNF